MSANIVIAICVVVDVRQESSLSRREKKSLQTTFYIATICNFALFYVSIHEFKLMTQNNRADINVN